MTPVEGAANAMATLSILLAGRNNVHTWWTGIVGCALFSVLLGRPGFKQEHRVNVEYWQLLQ